MASTDNPLAHPLDPLGADEFRRVVEVLGRDPRTPAGDGTADPVEAGVGVESEAGFRVGAGWRYASIELVEPTKAEVAAFRPGDEIRRTAAAVVWNRADGAAYRAVVSLSDGVLVAWEPLPGIQPNVTVDEWHECDEFVRATPELIEALARRGITDLSLVLVDVWAYGAALVPQRYAGLRIGWGDVWVRSTPDGNPYANPVGGLHPIVDLNRMELLELEDDRRPPDGPEDPAVMGEYLPALTGLPPRQLAALEIRQPQGVSFTLEGNRLSWQNWTLRIGFNYREGLVLHTVGYQDPAAPGGPRLRTVAHRLSFAEMVVPYRDPTPDHYRRTAFDIGEWGLGFMTTSLTLGCDCLGEIRYLDAVLHDSHGTPRRIENAICIHEEDNAVLWKHVDAGHSAEVRRMRRLVVSFHVTVANYEYLVYWRFYQDGSIESEVRATGIMVTTRIAAGDPSPPYGTLVDQRTYAPFHQHFIVARLDLDVDGTANTVYESHTEPLPIDPRNPHGLALTARNTALRSEIQGIQDHDWASQRSWKVVNEGVLNGIGTPVGYKLVPGASIPPMFDPASPVLARAGAIAHSVWVTPFSARERWPCGEFPAQGPVSGPGGAGLPEWTAADRSIENVDVVLWYVFGIHHVTRPEDWPVMPVDTVSFWLKPFGFFARNPSLDVPPVPTHHASPTSTATSPTAPGTEIGPSDPAACH
jgi:primary-amine oxidase